MIVSEGKQIIEVFSIKQRGKSFPELPNACPHCSSPNIAGVEVVGAFDGILFWQCEICSEYLLRFSYNKTLGKLEDHAELLIDIDDWEKVWKNPPD